MDFKRCFSIVLNQSFLEKNSTKFFFLNMYNHYRYFTDPAATDQISCYHAFRAFTHCNQKQSELIFESYVAAAIVFIEL